MYTVDLAVQAATICKLLPTVRTRHFLFLVETVDVVSQATCELLLTVLKKSL